MLGRDPWTERDQLMRDVCFIADVAVLPRWIRVSQALDYVAGVHPRFDRAKAEAFLAKTTIKPTSKVRELSKGMVTQLHLALVMAIDARLLVLDEPTLGLDILYRKQFYDSLLNDYFDRSRTIVVTTHQVEEIQHVLTDVMFIDRGRIVLSRSMEEFESRYREVMVHPDKLAAARALKPDPRAPGVRPQHPAVRRGRSAATRRARRRAHAEHRRPVRCRDGQSQRARHKERLNEYSIERRCRSRRRGREAVAPADISATRRLYWSVRRELWENRSIYLAPLAVAAVVLFGFFISLVRLPDRMRAAAGARPDASSTRPIEQPYVIAALMLMAIELLVAVFYCLDALYGERRDRSILFWKSLPVSDLTTVLSKASIPLLVLPLVTFAITVATQLIMLLASSAVLAAAA